MRYSIRTVTFDKVSINPSKSGVCPVCGKTAKRTKEFYQTLSPFNRTPDGEVKDARQIMAELNAKASVWLEEPTYHAKCEGKK